MIRRFLFAGLTMLTFTIGAMADLHRNEQHQFEATFPSKVEQSTTPIPEGGKVIVAFSTNKTHTFIIGAVVETDVELAPEQLDKFGKAFIEGLMSKRKNASIIKEEELKLSDTTPMGASYLVKHDTGHLLAWATIENGKGYFVIIEGADEDALKLDEVKKFQKSVKITGVK